MSRHKSTNRKIRRSKRKSRRKIRRSKRKVRRSVRKSRRKIRRSRRKSRRKSRRITLSKTSRPKITVYTLQFDKNECGYSTKAKELLNKHNIDFKEVKVQKSDRKLMDKINKKNKMELYPQIVIGNDVLGGYDDLKKNIKKVKKTVGKKQKIVMLIGYPGCGKTTYAKKKFSKNILISNDIYGSQAKAKKAAIEELKKGKSIVVDNLNSSLKNREVFIKLGKEFKTEINAVWFNYKRDFCWERNKKREKKIPFVTFVIFDKNFKRPTKKEGFNNIEIIKSKF